MTKTLPLVLCAVGLLANSANAQNTATIVAMPSQFTLMSGNVFDVTYTLTGGPTVVSAFDLFLESSSLNANNNFSITSRVLGAPGTNAGTPTFPDLLSTSTSDHAGFAQNRSDQGAFFNADQNAPAVLVTLTLQVDANTPNGNYTFSTTSSDTNTEPKATLVFGGPNTGDDFNQFSVAPASFTINVVPEPAAWALVVVGVTMLAGSGRMRRRRA